MPKLSDSSVVQVDSAARTDLIPLLRNPGTLPESVKISVEDLLANSIERAINVKDSPYGAAGTTQVVTDGAMSNGGNIITSATAGFTPSMIGWLVDMEGVGASEAGIDGVTARNNLAGTITGYNSPSTVTVSFTAQVAASAKQVTFGPNDTAAILAAKVAAGVGGELYFPPGNYAHNAEIVALSGMTIRGAGIGVSILTSLGATRNSTTADIKHISIPDGTSNVTIRDLSMRGTNREALQITSSAAVSYGIWVGTGGTGSISNLTFQNLEINSVWGQAIRSDGDAGDQLGNAPTVSNIKVLDCFIHHCSDNAVNLNTGGGLQISRCVLADNGAGGIEFAGSRIQVTDNYIARNRNGGFALGGLGNPSTGRGNIVKGNLIERNGSNGVGHGMQIGGNVVSAIISENIIRENQLQGIGVTDGNPDFASLSRDITIKNNHIVSNGATAAQGVGINIGLDELVVEDNDIYDDAATGFSQDIGILIIGARAKLLRNRVRNNPTNDYSFQQSTKTLFVREDTTSTVFLNTGVFTGTVDTSGTTVTHKTGDLFTTDWVNIPVRVNSVTYTISAVAAAPTGNFTTSGLVVTRTSGPSFYAGMVGKYIRIGPTYYFPIASVADADHLTITNTFGVTVPASGAWTLKGSTSLTLSTSAGTQTGVAYARDSHVIYPDNVFNSITFADGTVQTTAGASGGEITALTSTGTEEFALDASGGAQLTIANDATATPFGNANNFSGIIIINDPSVTGDTGMILATGGATTVVASNGGFSNTAGTGSKVNVYYSGGVLTIQNKLGASVSFRVFAIRMRAAA